jgi:hypothetical protein
MDNALPSSCPRPHKWIWVVASLSLIAVSPAQADLFSGDYVYTLKKNKILRTVKGTTVSSLNLARPSSTPRQPDGQRQTDRQNQTPPGGEDYNQHAAHDGKQGQPREESSMNSRMQEHFRQVNEQTEQTIADSFNKYTEDAYTPEFVDRTLLHANEAKIRATQTTAARVEKRLSQLQGSTSPSAAADRVALQEQLNLLRIQENRLRAEQHDIRN